MVNLILKKQIINNIFLISVFLFAISLLLPENFRNAPLILLSLSTILTLFIKFEIQKKASKIFLINTLLFFFLALSLSYTENISYGFNLIITLVGLLIIPLSFLITGVNESVFNDNLNQLFYKTFFITTILFFIGVFIQNYYRGFLNDSIFLHFSERLNSTYDKYSLHPIYASFYVSISLILATEILPRIKSAIYKSLYVCGVVFLVIILIMLARKGPIFITILIFIAYFFLKQKKKRLKAYFLLTLVFFLIVSYLIEPIKIRYVELINTILNFGENGVGSTSFRLNTYQCVIEKISDSPIVGYGIGDTKQVLIDCYKNKNNIYSSQYFNSHNQFFSAWLAAGILALVSMIIMFYINFKIAVKRADFVHFSILALFFIVMTTENILERQNGIIIFSFFLNFFAFKSIKSNS